MWSETETQIGKLEVRGAPRDDPALRLAVSNQLGSADLTSPGLPPSAILVVRRFSDPLPRRLDTEGGFIHVDSEWETAARAALSDLHRRARRPDQGRIVGNPEAVIFSDEAEFLACLSIDVSHGSAWRHWWWQTILRRMPPIQGRSSGVKSLFCHRALYIPAAISLLNQWGKVVPVVGAMTRADSLAVMRAMADSHGLGPWIDGLQHTLLRSGQDRDYRKRHSSAKSTQETVRDNSNRRNRLTGLSRTENEDSTPWHRFVDFGIPDKDLIREQAALLGLGVVLHRAPHVVHRSDFQGVVADWWLGKNDNSNKILADRQKSDDQPRPPEQPFKTKRPETVVKRAAVVKTESSGREKYDKNEQLEAAPIKRDSGAIVSLDGRQGMIGSRLSQDQTQEKAPWSSEDAASPDPTQRSAVRAPPPFFSPEFSPKGTRTRLGGVLYLINLMQQLNLPACFEPDWPATCRLGSWETLEVLARGLLFNADIELLNDPLWDALARLDNREPGVPPGGGFTRPTQYRLPADWWAFFPAVENPRYFWAVRKQRLRIWSELGFVLIDRLEQNPITENYLLAALQPYAGSAYSAHILHRAYTDAPVNYHSRPWLDGINSALLNWLALVLPFIRLYLMSTLHLRPEEPLELEKAAFFYPGELHVTASHVDLVMTLETISLPIRMAGLDRNPGWLADFGRVILFHFN
jgi:hypothetical protein